MVWEITSNGEFPYTDVWDDTDLVHQIEKGLRLRQTPNTPNSLYEFFSTCWNLEPQDRPSYDSIISSLKQIIHDHEAALMAISFNATTEGYIASPANCQTPTYIRFYQSQTLLDSPKIVYALVSPGDVLLAKSPLYTSVTKMAAVLFKPTLPPLKDRTPYTFVEYYVSRTKSPPVPQLHRLKSTFKDVRISLCIVG